MRVLVTGGAGFIGSHIVDAHIERGDAVSIVDNLCGGSPANVNPAARLYDVDLNDAHALAQAFADAKPEVVSHHAAQVSVRNSMTDPTHDAPSQHHRLAECASSLHPTRRRAPHIRVHLRRVRQAGAPAHGRSARFAPRIRLWRVQAQRRDVHTPVRRRIRA